jgi:osmotically-inducible protein OsmY
MKLLTKKYDDKLLMRQAERILASDPNVDHSSISVNSHKGVVTISGSVKNDFEQHHILEAIRRGYGKFGLQQAEIVDEIVVRRQGK